MRIVVEIEVKGWNKENIDTFHDWLVGELYRDGGGDNSRVVSVKKVVKKKAKKKAKKR